MIENADRHMPDPQATGSCPAPELDHPADHQERSDQPVEPVAIARSEPGDPGEQAPTTRRGRYRLGELLGRGGASVVHRGWDRRLERPVAVKLFTVEAPAAADREARVAAGMDHPGVVPVYDVEELDGQEAVVMPLVDGPSLAARLAESGPLPVAETLQIGAQLAAGLAHVHAHGVVHRDVKPSNVLLGARGARLTDFGIARVPGTTTITGDGLVLGTAAYLTPEQIRAEDVGPAADVFSLGLVLVECLTGAPCYSSTPGDCAARLDRPPTLPPGLDAEVAEALTALTRLDPADRPSATDAAARLGRLHRTALAPGSAPAAATAPGTAPATAPARRMSAAAMVIAALLFAAVSVAAIALFYGRPDVAIPVIVAAAAAQGAVVCFSLARRTDTRPPKPRPPAGAARM